MDDNQRGAMYDAWAKTKKWIEIEVNQIGDTWEAKTVPNPLCTIVRDTKAQAIYAISSQLGNLGYEILNLAEVQGIK